MGLRETWSGFVDTFGQIFKLGLFTFDIAVVVPAMFVFAFLSVPLWTRLMCMAAYFAATQSPLLIGIYRKLQHEKALVMGEAWESRKTTEQLVREYEEIINK